MSEAQRACARSAPDFGVPCPVAIKHDTTYRQWQISGADGVSCVVIEQFTHIPNAIQRVS